MCIARGGRLEPRLMQRQLGLLRLVFESHGRNHYGARGSAVRIGPATGEDNALGLDDFAKNSAREMIGALGRAHTEAIATARPHVHLAVRQRVAGRTPPAGHMPRLSPGLENEASRRIEGARDYQIELGRFRSDGISRGHTYSPSV